MASCSNQSSDITGTASLTWTIHNFSGTNTLVWSPKFYPSSNRKIAFRLGIFPNTFVQQRTNDEFVYLWHNQTEKLLNLEYEVSILKSNGEKGYTKKFYWNYEKCNALFDRHRNVTYLISSAKLKNEFIQNDKLTFLCEINIHASPVFPNKPLNPKKTEDDKDAVLQDYESLLESGKLSDVVLVVRKKEFHVHKLILSARSPVFAAMFEHPETKEAKEGRVTIPDVLEEVCELMLRYIYCGKIDKLKEFGWDLFVVADKYQLKHLKSICEQFICSSFTAESVVHVLIFSDMHIVANAQELKQKCMDYIHKNFVEVRKSESWKDLCIILPDLIVDLYADLSDKAKF